MANSITPHEARTIAAAAYCDPRSVVKVVRGEPVATLVMARIKNALAQLNRLDLLPATSAAEPPAAA